MLVPERDRPDTESSKVGINLLGSSFCSAGLALKKTPALSQRHPRNISSSAFVANCSLHQRNQIITQDPSALFKAFHTSSLWQSSKIKNSLFVRGWYSPGISLSLWRGAVQEAPDLPPSVLLWAFCCRSKKTPHGREIQNNQGVCQYLPQEQHSMNQKSPEKKRFCSLWAGCTRGLEVSFCFGFGFRAGFLSSVSFSCYWALFSPVIHLTPGHLLKSLIWNAREINLTLNFLRTSPSPD